LPVHYDTKKASKVRIDENTLWESDIKGFNSKVGFVTNCATSAFALLDFEFSKSIRFNGGLRVEKVNLL
jgi:hypothetical protein